MTGGSAGTAAIREPREFAAGLLVLPAGARVIPRGSHRMRPEEVFPEGTVGTPSMRRPILLRKGAGQG